MRAPALRIFADELIVDNFAGGGGASLGIELALGRSPDVAINHDAEAIAMHQANHPTTRHYCEDVWKVDPREACRGRPVGLAWFSPDCKHFSKAKGGKPASAAQLAKRVSLTAFSRTEFRAAYGDQDSPVDRAWAMIVRSFMGFGSASMTRMHITGFRSNASRNSTIPAEDWRNWPAEIQRFVERLRGVVIECRAAEAVVRQHDKPETLIYADPPYPQGTRSSLTHKNGNRGHYYRHDMTDDDHRALAKVLRACKGMVVLSGYPCELYDTELYPDWERFERSHMADGARPRTEVLWLNPGCSAALERHRAQPSLLN